MAEKQNVKDLLGCNPSSEILSNYLQNLNRKISSSSVPSPEIKTYPDALYMNYFALGLSLLFVPKDGSRSITKDKLEEDELTLDSIDIYNIPSPDSSPSAKSKAAVSAYSLYPEYPITVSLAPSNNAKISRASCLELDAMMTGKDVVQCLGEPERKGGGAGPSSGSIGIWCEWSKDGIMIEFGGEESRGPQAWEKGKDAVWSVLTVFQPKAN